MKARVVAQRKLETTLIESTPARREIELQAQMFIGTKQRAVDEIANAHRVSVGGKTRIEL